MSMAADPGWKLGVTRTAQIDDGSPYGVTGLFAATDSQGYVYLMGVEYTSSPAAYLIKLTPALDRVIYRTVFEFDVSGMAVDPAGNVYILAYNVVQKMSSDGNNILYRTVIGEAQLIGRNIAVDAAGRAYITGVDRAGDLKTTPGAFQPSPSASVLAGYSGFVVRLKPDGTIDYATYLGDGQSSSVAVDDAGSVFVTGTAPPDFPVTPGAYRASGDSFLARLSPDGSALVYSTFTDGIYVCCIALDSAGDAVVLSETQGGLATVIESFNPQGTDVLFSQTLPASPGALVGDKAGKIYAFSWASPNLPVKNSLVTCSGNGTNALTVFDTRGNVLQSTYLPTAGGFGPAAVLDGIDSAVDLVAFTSGGFSGFPVQPLSLTQLSPNDAAQTVQLACIGNAATFDSGISPGELVSLFGEGLGPTEGTQPEVTMQTGFPINVADTEVTINGIPVPLLYVQDGQINAIAPWSIQVDETVEICVIYKAARTNCLTQAVEATHPGVFTVDGYYAFARNQDWSINSAANPAKARSYVTVWATGLGAISPAQPDGSIVGLPLPVDVVPASMFWTIYVNPGFSLVYPITVQYAGPAPFEVAGVSQINLVADVNAFTLQVGQRSCPVRVYIEQ